MTQNLHKSTEYFALVSTSGAQLTIVLAHSWMCSRLSFECEFCFLQLSVFVEFQGFDIVA